MEEAKIGHILSDIKEKIMNTELIIAVLSSGALSTLISCIFQLWNNCKKK